jgi:hypothetical protein
MHHNIFVTVHWNALTYDLCIASYNILIKNYRTVTADWILTVLCQCVHVMKKMRQTQDVVFPPAPHNLLL